MNEYDELDRLLRQAYEPEAEVVRRVEAKALAHRVNRPVWRRATASIAFAAMLLVLLVLVRQPSQVQAETVQLDFVGGVAVFEYPDGSSWLFTPENAEGTPAGLNLIMVGGEER